jgi:hypothetical protein
VCQPVVMEQILDRGSRFIIGFGNLKLQAESGVFIVKGPTRSTQTIYLPRGQILLFWEAVSHISCALSFSVDKWNINVQHVVPRRSVPDDSLLSPSLSWMK